MEEKLLVFGVLESTKPEAFHAYERGELLVCQGTDDSVVAPAGIDNPPITETGELLRDGKRPWRQRKSQSRAVGMAYLGGAQDEQAQRKAHRILDCGAVLVFAECPHGHERRLKYAEFCHWPLCPMCQWRKSLVIFHQLLAVCHTLQQCQSGTRYLLLTLTVVNVPAEELPATLDRMFRAWKRLENRAGFARSVLGWFRTLEITYNRKDRTYHPHFHVLLAVRSSYFKKHYIKHARWLALWQEAMRDLSIQFVNIKAVKPNQRIEGNHPLAGAAAEVGKYATKPGNYIRKTSQGGYEADPDVVAVLDRALKHRRLTAYGGAFRDIRKELELVDVEKADLVRVEGQEVVCQCSVCQSVMWEHIYRWKIGLGDYVG